MFALGEVDLVESGDEIELFALVGAGEMGVAEVGDQLVHGHVVGIDGGGLVLAGKESVGPQLGPNDGSARRKHYVTRQVTIFAAESV